MTEKTKAFLLFAAMIVMYVIIGLWATGSFGNNNFESSDYAIRPLINPPPLTFAIWSPIYLGLTALVIYQIFPAQLRSGRLTGVRMPLAINLLANSFWLVFSSYLMLGVALCIMMVILSTLVYINNKLKLHEGSHGIVDGILVVWPISLYFGWVILAAVLNVTSVLYIYEWSGWGMSEEFWTYTMMIIAFGLTSYIYQRHGSLYFLLVIIWAFSNLAIRHIDTYPGISYMAIVMVLMSIIQLIHSVWAAKKRF